MAENKDGRYAFPIPADDRRGWPAETGMTMRDWFASHAPEVPSWFRSDHPRRAWSKPGTSGIQKPVIPDAEWNLTTEKWHMERRVAWAWAYADAMIAAREPVEVQQ